MWRGAIAWIPVFTGMTRGECRGMAGGNRVDSRFHGNDKGGVAGNGGVWRESTRPTPPVEQECPSSPPSFP